MTSVEPKVSVCVLTYNQEPYVGACLQSIVDQETAFPFEVIVADDCSTDGTARVVAEFGKRYPHLVKLVLRPKNLGPTPNFLDAHNRANGLYVAHMDGDDLMLPGKLQKQADFLDAHSEFAAVWHRFNLFDDNGGFVSGECYDLSLFPDGVITLDHALRLGFVSVHSSMMYRRSARKTRSADFEMLDLFSTWEYLCSGKGKILEDILGSYRVASQSSVQVGRVVRIHRLVAHHARHFLSLLPEQRHNIFVFAFLNFLVEAKNLRTTAWDFGRLVLASASFVSPMLILKTFRETRQMPACSAEGMAQLARSLGSR